MQFSNSKRLTLSFIYLGALLLIAGTLFYRVQHFSGTALLLPGSPDHLVFRPHASGLALGIAQRNVPPDLLLSDSPRALRALRKDQHYDAVVLPFALRLEGVETLGEKTPLHRLIVEGPETARTVEIEAGMSLPLGSDALEVARIGTWAGLVRSAAGGPMAALSIGRGDSAEVLFLEPGVWSIPRSNLALHFSWHKDEAAARARSATSLDALAAARWGAIDGKAIQWVENFVPGTALSLRNGTRVALAEDGRADGWVDLIVTEGGAGRTLRIQANDHSGAEPYFLEDPAATGRAVEVHAWREDQALCRMLTLGVPPREQIVSPGAGWDLPPDGLTLQLGQVMASAVAVPAGALGAAYARLGDTDYTLREGVAETVGDYRIRYEKTQPPPEARCTLAVLAPDGTKTRTVTLVRGARVRIGAWVLSLSEENPFAPEGIAVTAERRPGGLAQSIGLAMFLTGCFGLLLVRFGRKRAV